MRKELNYAALTKINFVSSVLSGVIGVFLAFYGAGVGSLVTQVLLRGIFYNIYICLISEWLPAFSFSFKALKQLWGFGFRIFLSGMLDAIFTRLDIVIIGKIFTPALLGFYGRAKSLEQLAINYSSGSLMAVLFPLLSKVQNDLLRFQNIIIKSLDILSFIIFLLLGGLYLTSEELIVFLFSDKWLPSVDYYKILILSGFAYPVSSLFVNVLQSRGNSKDFLRLEIYKKILTAINLSFGFYWGIEGYLYGLVVVSTLATYLNMIYASREINIPIITYIQPIIIQMIISVISVIVVTYITIDIQSYGILLLFIKGILFVFCYIGISWLFKTNSFITFKNQLLPLLNRQKKG
jgi:O-antigen/teichoic acid export membrane protein